jgi:acetyl esterase/lipase
MRRVLSCLVVMTGISLHADDGKYVSLDDGHTIPAPPSYYNRMWETQVVTVGATPCLQVLPTTKTPSKGTIIIAPGGGYQNLSVSKEGTNIASILNEDGWDAAILDYTVGKPEDLAEVKKKSLDESEKALALVQKHGSDIGLSSAQVGLMGLSAGGDLAIRTAHETASTNPPNFLALLYPAYLDKDGQLVPGVIPPNIPIFLFVGDKDWLTLGGSKLLASYCQDHGIKCDFTIAPGVGHGFGITKDMPEGARNWPDKLKAFLDSLPAPGTAAPNP